MFCGDLVYGTIQDSVDARPPTVVARPPTVDARPPTVDEGCIKLCQFNLGLVAEDDNFLTILVFIDESNFHVSVLVECDNIRI